VSQVARGIEESGIATVGVHLRTYRRWAVERLKFPRVLFSPFFLGRLLGEPGNAAQQRAMVERALALLSTGTPGATDDPDMRWRDGQAAGGDGE
jgi:hypothetical protein